MNFGIVFSVLGSLLRFLGPMMLVPLGVALYYGESPYPFAVAFSFTTIVGSILSFRYSSSDEREWEKREGFAIVAFGWFAAALFGSIPYMFDGVTFLNALFESMSGFTTTGATVFVDIETHSRSLLFWRSMTQWIGGMGIIMLFIAILPKLGVAGRQMFRAEAPGPKEDQLKPRIRETAKILWAVYVSISVVELLLLLIAGMSFYDACMHTFTTMACGGFSPYADSVAAFNSPLIEGIITLFMFIAGANFALHYKTLYSDKKSLLKDNEFKFYFVIVGLATVLLTLILWRDTPDSIPTSFRYAVFQVVSILTTTGYATTDFNLWADSGKVVLLAMMFIGGCAGSTAGGIKVVRLLLLLKYARSELFKAIHPKAVRPIKFNGKSVPVDIMHAIISFVVIYFLIFLISSAILSIFGMDLTSSVTASIATLGNIGPGFNMVGPMANFSTVPAIGKLVLIANMWIGRLEVFTVIVMLTPEFWRR
ncbi:trk system potassium uptake protein TrkH [Methanococcoides vulcani]|uniref:Trk system potassium uptake protein TrkH n=1 Tax=Methanococcoides vulcani TaxID=1353158 RepID=A0A1H9YAV7_9EURY|nr:TrkH family potassium uptake protein [Methanococcoides vulcani]SES65556.1 trk system potassium uptake protein TrkH [Methanococcoides vulcani]